MSSTERREVIWACLWPATPEAEEPRSRVRGSSRPPTPGQRQKRNPGTWAAWRQQRLYGLRAYVQAELRRLHMNDEARLDEDLAAYAGVDPVAPMRLAS